MEAAVWDKSRATSWGSEAGQADFSRSTETTGGARGGFMKCTFHSAPVPPSACPKLTILAHGQEDLLLPLSFCASASCNDERGCISPAQNSRISVYLGSAIKEQIPSVCAQATALDNLSHPLCAVWSRPRESWMGPAEHPFSHCSASEAVTGASI